MKKIFALVLALMLVLGMLSAFADESSSHVITITNNDQYVSHTYEAYQVFKGKLDDRQTKLSDIQWGSGVNGGALLTALQASPVLVGDNPATDAEEDDYNLFTACVTAADVAKVLGTFASTSGESQNAGMIDEVASIISNNLTTTKATFTESAAGKSYTATVTGDGYYFIKDTTTTLTSTTGSDTKSKFLLAVVKDTTIVAKDTHMTPNKQILIASGEESAETYTRVKEDSAAVGDVETFEVTIPVPNTRKYVDHFVFVMDDTLPVGMTFTGITSVKVGTDDVPYTLTVAAHDSDTYAAYTAPSAEDAVTTAGGQKIKVTFNNFKANAEENGWIGETLVVTYTAVVNKDADFTPTGNENEVYFEYSNDPNHDYDGDEPEGPMGETPRDKTKTKLINLEILKTGDNGAISALEGAEFEITSNEYNVTLVSGEKFEASDYEAQTGETIQSGTYYKLADGSYTTTAPTDSTASLYDSTTTTYKKVTFANSIVTPGTSKKVTVITGIDGKISLAGIAPGTYSVKETKAPTGYNLDPNTYTLKVDWNYTASSHTGTFSLDEDESSDGVDWTATTATVSITIDNKGGSTLPSTGGIGTTIFYVGGSILVLAAVILLVTKRRMNANND